MTVSYPKRNLIQFLNKGNSVFSWGTLTWESIQFNKAVRVCASNSGLQFMELSVHLEISPWVRLLEISTDKESGSSVEYFTGSQWLVTTASQAISSRTRLLKRSPDSCSFGVVAKSSHPGSMVSHQTLKPEWILLYWFWPVDNINVPSWQLEHWLGGHENSLHGLPSFFSLSDSVLGLPRRPSG